MATKNPLDNIKTAADAQAFMEQAIRDDADRRVAEGKAEDAAKAAKKDRLKNLIKWETGTSGNPGGQPSANPGPKSLAARVRAATKDNQEQIEFFQMLANGEIEGAAVADRIKAHEWLANRGHGKAPDTVVNVTADADSLEDVSSDELRDLLKRS